MTEVDFRLEVHGLPGPAIDVGAIERQLSKLWRTPSSVGLTALDAVPTRTSVLNLIVYASGTQALADAAGTIDHLAAHHPSRVIVFAVCDDPRAFEGDLDAKVTAHCHAGADERFATCYEQVTITTPPHALQYLPSLMLPLSLPDLPTFLWWPGQPPLHDRQFLRVTQSVDRLVVDSLEFTHTAANLARLAALCRQLGERCCLTDLSWARLTHWRELTAQFFDMPEYAWALGTINRIAVTYGRARSATDNPAQALLYIGWLASRLGWELISTGRTAGGWVFTAGPPGDHDVRIELRDVPAARRLNGYLMSAAIAAGDGRRSAGLEAARTDDPGLVKIRAYTGGEVRFERAIRSAPAGAKDLLVDELKMLTHDVVYERAMQEARHFAEAIRGRTAS